MYVYLKLSLGRLPEDPAHFQYFLLIQPGIVRAFISRKGYAEIIFNDRKTSREKVIEILKAFEPKILEEKEFERLEEHLIKGRNLEVELRKG